MSQFNKVILMGNLTRDPELRYSQDGLAIVRFGMAVNEKYKDKERTTFVDLTAFGKTGETIQKYLAKGDPIFIDGRLDYSTWDDKTTGAKRNKLAVIVNQFQFVGSKQDRTPAAPDTTDTVPF
jgi:single-strand DNA-binding protein